MKKLLTFLLALLLPTSLWAATLVFPSQGGTGQSTGTVGSYLRVTSTAPFTYDFGPGGGSSGLASSSFATTTGVSILYSGSAITFGNTGVTALNGSVGSVNAVTSLNLIYGDLSIATSSAGSDFDFFGGGAPFTLQLPNAGPTARGVVSTTTQTFAGVKKFGNDTSFTTSTIGTILTSPDGTCFRLSVSNLGVLTTNSITCP